MTVTRRDVLWGLGGGLAGAALTPVPWKLLDDTAIWTQRRHALPVPARGPVTLRPAACTLCPAGCAVRVRCVGARPVAVVGEAAHPLGGGACAHRADPPPPGRPPAAARRAGRARGRPARGRRSRRGRRPRRGGGRQGPHRRPERDGPRPAARARRLGRLAASSWRPCPRASTRRLRGRARPSTVLQRALARPALLGIDLERTRTLVSFGAPVLEGWGRPGRMLAVRGRLRVVQVDAWRSPSAALADEWVAIAPGGEGPLALALAQRGRCARGARASTRTCGGRSGPSRRSGSGVDHRRTAGTDREPRARRSCAKRRPWRSAAATRARVPSRRTPSARSRS